MTMSVLSDLPRHHPQVHVGGSYMPHDCTARQRIAIIIPFKGRIEQLKVFLNNIHPFLQRQQAHYQIFVSEPVSFLLNTTNLPPLRNIVHISYPAKLPANMWDCLINSVYYS